MLWCSTYCTGNEATTALEYKPNGEDELVSVNLCDQCLEIFLVEGPPNVYPS